MARDLGIQEIPPGQRGWDSPTNTNFERFKERVENVPLPLPLVYKTTPAAGAIQLSTYAAADFLGCFAYLTDAATIATNGHMIYSDGTSWKYVKSEAAV